MLGEDQVKKRAPSTIKILTEDTIKKRANVPNIQEVKNLNMWGLNLTDVSIIEKMPALENIALSVNKIQTLKPFAACTKLRELFLRNNLISDFEEIGYLVNLKHLRTLWLSENPISKEPNYRSRVIQMLPQITKLDESDVTAADRIPVDKIPSERISPQQQYSKADIESLPPVPLKQEYKPPSAHRSVSKPRKNDAPVLTAVLSLLPELSIDSLEIVLHKIRDLTQ
ncbi:Leucine Rich Repeat family protein [Trichomonas vaginalis G3]|uniref:Leucine Rich Repeat family protein n=1 Tax=Trichomonas vaginalis (strain ATCC PRA-98 / G3) TaxID=412133 RepID=A2FIT7_TRIV3|nr:uncharacterized protein TVAGG3_0487830 [Trichomonas vaginalis G3]EAX95190.1 Leucine Rich Repeat family protein [Trichomonas vaginalis G3]KAI5516162.1 DNA damage response, detection of DNA damage [Trichomonas vaginalis G3]|eukprot:XP_001308120.1 hypothetical protein [Trichomonas vaginalis G3]